MRNGLILKSLHVFTTSTERLATFLFFSFSRERERWVNTPIQTKKKKGKARLIKLVGLRIAQLCTNNALSGFQYRDRTNAMMLHCAFGMKKIKGSGKSTFFSFFLFLFCISRGIPASILCSSSFIGLCHPHRFHTFSSQFVACSACKPRSAPRHLDPIVSPNNFQLSPFLVSLIVSKFDRSQGTSSLQGHQHNNDHIDAQAIQQENGGGGKKGWKI